MLRDFKLKLYNFKIKIDKNFDGKIFLKKSLPILIFFVMLIFQIPLESLVSKFVVDVAFSKVVSTGLIDAVFAMGMCISIYLVALKIKSAVKNHKILSAWSVMYALLLGLSYSHYRFSQTSCYSFEGFEIFSPIYYFDFIIVIITLFFLEFKPRHTELDKGPQSFFEDSSATFQNIDLFNRESYSEKITRRTMALKTEKSFAIAIIGKWGEGKSFLFKKVEERIKKAPQTNLIIHFDPWKYPYPQNVLPAFFKELIINIGDYSESLSSKLNKYSAALVTVNESALTKAISGITNLIEPELSIASQYHEINKALCNFGRRIHIFIDDIDRLDKTEIIAILKLIRNTANFPNLVYYVAFDYNYLTEILKGVHNSEDYLKKIFQLMITLPENSKEILFAEFKTLLTEGENDISFRSHIAEVTDQLKTLTIIREDDVLNIPHNIFNDFFYNLRDIVRFVNQFKLEYSFVEDSVDLFEFILILILKINDFKTYTQLKNRRLLYSSTVIGTGQYSFNEELFDKLADEKTNTASKVILNYIYNSIRQVEITLSARYIRNHSLYFFYDKNTNVTYNKFLHIKKLAFNNDFSQMSEEVKSVNKDDLINVVLDYETYIDRTDYESTILTLRFLFYNSEANKQELIANTIISKLSKFDDLKAPFYKDSLKAYKKFIVSIINTAFFPYILEAEIALNFLRRLLRKDTTNNPFEVPELKKIILAFFEEYLSKSEKLSITDFILFYKNFDSIDLHSNIVTISKIACNRLKEKILQNSENQQFYASFLIRDYGIPNVYNMFTLEPFIESVWDGYINFEEFLQTLPENIDNLELKAFYLRFKLAEYKPISIKRRLIEIISDIQTVYIDPSNQNQFQASHVFDFMDYKNNLILDSYNRALQLEPAFKFYKWIAHCEPKKLTDNEATFGGEYVFVRRFSLPDASLVSSAKLILIVDDYCEVQLNKKIIIERDHSKENPYGFIYNLQIDESYFGQNNELRIAVHNKSAKEISPDSNDNNKWTSDKNIYWLVYGLQFTLEQEPTITD